MSYSIYKSNRGEINVNKSLVIRLYPNNRQQKSIDQNIANHDFIWNRLVEKCKYENVEPTNKNLNNVVNDLKEEYPFLKKVNQPSDGRFELISYKRLKNIKIRVQDILNKNQEIIPMSHLEFNALTITYT